MRITIFKGANTKGVITNRPNPTYANQVIYNSLGPKPLDASPNWICPGSGYAIFNYWPSIWGESINTSLTINALWPSFGAIRAQEFKLSLSEITSLRLIVQHSPFGQAKLALPLVASGHKLYNCQKYSELICPSKSYFTRNIFVQLILDIKKVKSYKKAIEAKRDSNSRRLNQKLFKLNNSITSICP